jgi:hypothetical protein
MTHHNAKVSSGGFCGKSQRIPSRPIFFIYLQQGGWPSFIDPGSFAVAAGPDCHDALSPGRVTLPRTARSY